MLDEGEFTLLPEAHQPHLVVDEVNFSEVTDDGEVYTLYRIVRFTHQATNDSMHWTHRANVVGVRTEQLGTALLRIVERLVEDAKVKQAPDLIG